MSKILLSRRKFFIGAAASVAAPAIIRIIDLMPIRKLVLEETMNSRLLTNQPTRLDVLYEYLWVRPEWAVLQNFDENGGQWVRTGEGDGVQRVVIPLSATHITPYTHVRPTPFFLAHPLTVNAPIRSLKKCPNTQKSSPTKS